MKGYQILAALTLLLLSAIGVQAQTADYEYVVKFRDTDGKEIPAKGRYGHYFDYSEAQSIYQKCLKLKDNYKQVEDDGFSNENRLFGTNNGMFAFQGAKGMGVIFVVKDLQEDFVLIRHEDVNVTNKVGRTSGDNRYLLNCKHLGNQKYQYTLIIDLPRKIENVDIIKPIKNIRNRRRAFDMGDGMEHFELHLQIPTIGRHAEDSRIILLPYAIDCDTEDTVAYLPPAVYEGSKYHTLQNRRKGFNYTQNDPLGRSIVREKIKVIRDTIWRDTTYNEAILKDGRTQYKDGKALEKTVSKRIVVDIKTTEKRETSLSSGFICLIDSISPSERGLPINKSLDVYEIDTIIDWKKPNKKKTYRCIVKYSIEDYHRTFRENEDPGTCLRINPFKFLQMGTAAVDIPLTQEFFENAEEKATNADKGLRMQFQYNSANIIEDSLTNIDIQELRDIIHDINVNHGSILGATLEAYASPDGREDVNRRLAGERAIAARSRLGLGGMKIDTKAVIDTWENTAKLLDEGMHPREAQAIRNALANSRNDYEAYQEIRKMETYADVVKPTLEKQCRINFKFKFFSKRKLNPKEAVQAYYKNRHDFFSNGDYFNMFAEIKDSVELDTLTTIVYNRLIKQQKAYDRPLAPYVVNRMAMMGIRRNMPDTTILAPLIDEQSKIFRLNTEKKDPDGIMDPIKMNRPEIILNQAVIYYILEDPERAHWYVEMLEDNHYQSPALERLKSYINFKRLYMIPENSRTDKEQRAFESALAYVEKSAVDNKAVLYTEFEALGKRSIARQEVLKMRDDNPVKWYLMGILWANTLHGKESDFPLDETFFSRSVSKPKSDNPLLTSEEEEDLKFEDYSKYAEYLKTKQEYLNNHPNAKPEPRVKKGKNTIVDGVDMSVDVKGIPYYLGYFQHCFDMDEKYKKYYFNDGQVDEEKRKMKKHAYKNNNIPAYKKIFMLRKVDDDRERQELQKMLPTYNSNNKDIQAEGHNQAVNDTSK